MGLYNPTGGGNYPNQVTGFYDFRNGNFSVLGQMYAHGFVDYNNSLYYVYPSQGATLYFLSISQSNSSQYVKQGSHLNIDNPSGTQSTIGFTFNGVYKANWRVDSSGNMVANALGSYYFNIEYGSNPTNFNNRYGTFMTIGNNTVTFPGYIQASSLGVGTTPSGIAGEIRATNNITGFYSSDRKLKENIIDIKGATKMIQSIGGKTFNWTDKYIEEHGGVDGYFVRKNDFGVIAQDVQEVFPLAVREKPDGSLAVDYNKLVALAFAAIKEQQQQIDELKKKIYN
jgi:hypothetical protein